MVSTHVEFRGQKSLLLANFIKEADSVAFLAIPEDKAEKGKVTDNDITVRTFVADGNPKCVVILDKDEDFAELLKKENIILPFKVSEGTTNPKEGEVSEPISVYLLHPGMYSRAKQS